MWLKKLVRRVKMFLRRPPSMYLDCNVRGEREYFHIYGSAGFMLKGFSEKGDRMIQKCHAAKPEHWQRIWDHLNPTAVVTWEPRPEQSDRYHAPRNGDSP